MIVDADAVAKFAAEQRAGGHGEDFARQIPERHLDAAGGAEEVVRGAVGARAGKVFRAHTQVCVQGIDLQRIFPHEPRLDGKNLLAHADAGSSVRLSNAIQPVIGNDSHQNVGARCSLHRHGLHIADLDALPFSGRKAMVCGQERNAGGSAQKLPPG